MRQLTKMYDTDCDTENTIRPTSSSLTRGPSWSLGVGASEFGDNLKRISAGTSQNEDSQTRLNVNYPKLDLQIPTVYLTKKDPSKSSFHVYELRIKLLNTNQEWSVYRRYSQFHALHHQLKVKDPAIGKLHFPPKKRLNSKASTIVQDRRRKLEEYIRSVNFYLEHLPPDSGEDAGEQQSQQLRSMLSIGSGSAVYVDESSRDTFNNDGPDEEQANPAAEAGETRIERARSIESDAEATTVGSASSGNPVEEFFHDGNKSFEKFSIRMLFNIFISIKDKRDDEFSPENLDNTLSSEETLVQPAAGNPSSSG